MSNPEDKKPVDQVNILLSLLKAKKANRVESQSASPVQQGSNKERAKPIEGVPSVIKLTEGDDSISKISISPNKQLVAYTTRASKDDGTIRVLDLRSGELLHSLTGHSKEIKALAISSDEQLLVSVDDDKVVRIWELDTGGLFHSIEGIEISWDRAIMLSPDGGKLISNRGETIEVVDLATGELVKSLPERTRPTMKWVSPSELWSDIGSAFGTCIAGSPDGSILATGHNCSNDGNEEYLLKIWNLKSGVLLHTIQAHSHFILCAAISPNGQRIVTGSSDGTIKVWNLNTGRLLLTFKGHLGAVDSVVISPDGQALISAGSDCTLRLWNFKTGAELCVLAGSVDMSAIALDCDGKTLITGGSTVKILDLSDLQGITPQSQLQAEHKCKLENVSLIHAFETVRSRAAISPDGQVLATRAAYDDGIALRNPAAGGRQFNFISEDDYIRSLVFSADGQTLITGTENSIKIWDLKTRELIYTLTGFSSYVNSLAVSPDGRKLVSGDDEGTIKIWDLSARRLLTTFDSGSERIKCIVMNPSGQTFFSFEGILFNPPDPLITIWDLGTGKLLDRLATRSRAVSALAVSSDGKTLVSGLDEIEIWDLNGMELLRTLDVGDKQVTDLAISPNQQRLVSGHDEAINIWNLKTGQLLRTIETSQKVEYLFITPDGQTLISGDREGAKIWQV